VLGASATVPAVAGLLDTPERAVRDEVAVLFGIGLAWSESDRLCLPERLREHWTAELGGGRPVAKMGVTVLADELRVAAAAHDVSVEGMRKPELIAGLAEMMADPRRLVKVIGELPAPARLRLEELRLGGFGIMFGFVDPRSAALIRPSCWSGPGWCCDPTGSRRCRARWRSRRGWPRTRRG
jgi:hypothetical protein